MTTVLDPPTRKKRPHHHWTVPQIRRVVRLARAGLSDPAIAIVLSVDFEVDVSAHTVRSQRRRFAPQVRGATGVARDNSANFRSSDEADAAARVLGGRA